MATKAAALALPAALGPGADALLRGAACAVLLAATVRGGLLASAGLGSAMSSSCFPAALTQKNSSATPPSAITAAPM